MIASLRLTLDRLYLSLLNDARAQMLTASTVGTAVSVARRHASTLVRVRACVLRARLTPSCPTRQATGSVSNFAVRDHVSARSPFPFLVFSPQPEVRSGAARSRNQPAARAQSVDGTSPTTTTTPLALVEVELNPPEMLHTHMRVVVKLQVHSRADTCLFAPQC